MKQLSLMALGMLLIPLAQAAGFDCDKAALPIEKVICADQTLSQADDQINDAYTFLLAQCRDVAAHADLRATQRAWLAGIRKDYGEGSPEALDRLEGAYRVRNDVLARLLAECNPDHGPVRATVRTVSEESGLFVETNPPQSGWRINKVLFRSYRAAPPLEFSGLKAFLATHKPVDNNGGYETFSLVSNKGNLLVLHVSGTDCEPDAPRCSPYDMQYPFDIRTGRIVLFEELYTDEGAHQLSQRLKDKLLDLAKSRFAAASKADAEVFGEQYRRCLDNWKKQTEVGVVGSFTADGRLQFGLGYCSNYKPYGPDPEEQDGTALDNLSLTVALPELRPYLSVYGKSVLLGDGDVRTPPADAPLACKQEGGLTVRRNDSAHVPGIEASAGEEHYLLLTPDGKLWGWGDNIHGELGAAPDFKPVPQFLGGNYLQVGGGQSYTAALQRDGSLWTWGSNYDYRLGDGATKPSKIAVRIGEHFISLKVESYGAMALKQDGTAWGWGGEKMQTPQQLMADVAQIQYGLAGRRLMLKKDGSLWALGGFSYPEEKSYDATTPRLLGKGFTHLPVHHGDLAYKADGSLWAWGSLAAASFRLNGEQSYERPVNIGSGFVQVKVGGVYSAYIAALKADGSLWLARTRGATTRLEPVGCGYAEVVAGGEYLLALKQDGNLEVWSNWATPEAIAQREQRELMSPWGRLHPVQLGKSYTRLFQVGDLWGDMGAKAVALRKDGSAWLFNPPRHPSEGGPKEWFNQVPFPKEANLSQ